MPTPTNGTDFFNQTYTLVKAANGHTPSEADMIITLASVVAQVQKDHFLNNICAEEIKTPAGDLIQDRWNHMMSEQNVMGSKSYQGLIVATETFLNPAVATDTTLKMDANTTDVADRVAECWTDDMLQAFGAHKALTTPTLNSGKENTMLPYEKTLGIAIGALKTVIGNASAPDEAKALAVSVIKDRAYRSHVTDRNLLAFCQSRNMLAK